MKKRLYIDANAVLDFLAMRELFWVPMAKIVSLAEKKELAIVVSPISFASVSYLLSKVESHYRILGKLRNFRIVCEVSEINGQTMDKALKSKFADFEDALQYYWLKNQIAITRNGKDFKESSLPIMTAAEYLKSII